MVDFSFVRDVEHYKYTFDNPKELWERSYDEIGACDALLVDVSDHPTGGRLVETGIAYALRKPIIVTKKHGVDHKQLFDGVASVVIEYEDDKDLTRQLKKYEKDHNFNMTDKSILLVMFLMLGGLIGWVLGQFFIPLAFVGAIGYWLIVRRIFASMRSFDRVVIYIPLIFVWLAGFFLLKTAYIVLAFAWIVGFWLVALYVLRKLKFSL